MESVLNSFRLQEEGHQEKEEDQGGRVRAMFCDFLGGQGLLELAFGPRRDARPALLGQAKAFAVNPKELNALLEGDD